MAAGPQQLPPQAILNQMIMGAWISPAIGVVPELGVADALTDGPRSAEELAGTAGAHADSLNRVMRALATAGIFCQTSDGRFEQTPLSECLRDVPGSSRAWARMNRAGWQW